MKLNKRLTALATMVKHPYDLVWDCCCDHGFLGMKILADGLVKNVNFVDVVSDIVERLDIKLTTHLHHLPIDAQWQTICDDVANISLHSKLTVEQMKSQETPNQLVIISGVGGDLMIDILDKLVKRYNDCNIDYLLCPVQHTYKLRNKLQQLNFKLKQEELVIENNRGYELLLINQLEGCELSLVGSDIWKNTQEHKNYVLKLIAHYQRVVTSKNEEALNNKAALKSYEMLYKRYFKNE